MKALEEVLKSLKSGKCRDPEGMIREIFKDEVMGDDLKSSLLTLLNRIKATGKANSLIWSQKEEFLL